MRESTLGLLRLFLVVATVIIHAGTSIGQGGPATAPEGGSTGNDATNRERVTKEYRRVNDILLEKEINLLFDGEAKLVDYRNKELVLKRGQSYALHVGWANLESQDGGKVFPYDSLRANARIALAKRFQAAANRLEGEKLATYSLLADLGGWPVTNLHSLKHDFELLARMLMASTNVDSIDMNRLGDFEVLKPSWFADLQTYLDSDIKLIGNRSACLREGLSISLKRNELNEGRLKVGHCGADALSVALTMENVEHKVIKGVYEKTYLDYRDTLKRFTCTDCMLGSSLDSLKYYLDIYQRVAKGLRDCDCEEAYTFSPCSPYFDTAYVLVDTIYSAAIETRIKEQLPRINSALVEWMFVTLWMHEDDPRLNPLPYTDDKFLITKSFDKDKAGPFDKYIDSLLRDMRDSDQLNPTRANLSFYDSLLNLKGEGSAVYAFKAYNDSLRRENATAKAKFAANDSLILHKVDFAIADKPGTIPTIATWKRDAYGSFRQLPKRFPNMVLGNRPAFLIAPNLARGSNIRLQAKRVADTKQTESPTISGISRVITAVSGFAGPLAGLVASAVGELSSKSEGERKLNIYVPQEQFSTEEGRQSLVANPVLKIVSCESLLQNNGFNVEVSDAANINYYLSDPEGIELQIKSDIGYIYPYLNHLSEQGEQGCPAAVNSIHSISCASLTPVARELLIREISRYACEMLKENHRLTADQIKSRIRWPVNSAFYAKVDSVAEEFNKQFATLKTLYQKWGDSDTWVLPPQKLGPSTRPIAPPKYTTGALILPTSDTAGIYQVKVYEENANRKKLDSVRLNYASAPGHVLSVSGGVAYTTGDDLQRFEVIETDNGGLSFEEDDNQVRAFAAVHIHPFRMIDLYDRFLIFDGLPLRDQLSRFSIFLGTSFPKPLYNIHTGVAIDWLPGIKTVFGHHWYRQTKFEILNNTIADESSRYQSAGFFFGLTLDPVAIASITGLIKN